MVKNISYLFLVIIIVLSSGFVVAYPLNGSSTCASLGTCQVVVDTWINNTWNWTVGEGFSTGGGMAATRWYTTEGSYGDAFLNSGAGSCPVRNSSSNQFCVVTDEHGNVQLSAAAGTNQTKYELLHNFTEALRLPAIDNLPCWKAYVNGSQAYTASILCKATDSASDADLRILGAQAVACAKQKNGTWNADWVDYCADYVDHGKAIFRSDVVQLPNGKYFLCNGYNNAAGTCPTSSQSFRPDYYELGFLMSFAEYTNNDTRINAVLDMLEDYNSTIGTNALPQGKTGYFNDENATSYRCGEDAWGNNPCQPSKIYMDNIDTWRGVPALSILLALHPERINASINASIFTFWWDHYSGGNSSITSSSSRPFEIYSNLTDGWVKQSEDSYKTLGMWIPLSTGFNDSYTKKLVDRLISNKYDSTNGRFYGSAYFGGFYSQYAIRAVATASGLLDPASYPAPAAQTYCYQETANVSTLCGGLINGSYGNVPNYVYMNYSIPVLAISGSKWLIQIGQNNPINYTIPVSCMDQSSSLELRVYSNKIVNTYFQIETTVNGDCWNGVSWEGVTPVYGSTGIFGTANSVDSISFAYDGLWDTNAFWNADTGAWRQANNQSTSPASYDFERAALFEEAVYWLMTPQPIIVNDFNITFYNESTDTILNKSIKVIIFNDVFSKNYTSTNGLLTLTLDSGDYTVRYWRENTVVRDYYFTVTNLTNNDLRLYLLDDSSSTYYVAVITDSVGNPCLGETVKALRYFENFNGYRVVQMDTSDSNGNTVYSLVPNVINYKFLMTGSCGSYTTEPQKIVSTSNFFSIVNSQILDSFLNIDKVSTSLVFINSTLTYVFNWDDAGSLITDACLTVDRTSNGSTNRISDNCISGSSGSLIYTITENVTNNLYYAQGKLITNTAYSEYGVGGVWASFLDGFKTWGKTGVFLGMFLFLAVVLAVGGSPSTVVISSAGSLVLIIYFGFVYGIASVIPLLIIAGILVYKMRSG